jgi:hypothetical protein
MRLIDPPSDFASLEEWRDFASQMEQLQREDPDDADIAEHLTRAREMIDQLD